MSSGLEKLEQVRIEKLAKIAELGIDPWGSRFEPREDIGSLRARVPEDNETQIEGIRAAGRILSIRDTGRVQFIDLQDRSGRLQLMVGKKQVGEENWKLVQLLDLWDLVGVDGKLGRTRTGEITIFAERITLLTKTVAHPPEKYHGAQDIEVRLRRRYVDMVQNPEVLGRFEARAKVIRYIRRELGDRDFVEVETPTMQAIAGGAAARPFITHHNALDIELFMRIAPELFLKRLLVGGMERVFEIGRVWRNEGIDASHNPEFTMLELYQAYGDYASMMDLTEALIAGAARHLGKDANLEYAGRTIDLSTPWRRATYDELLIEHAGVSLHDVEGVRVEAQRQGIPVEGKHPDVLVNQLFEMSVEDHLEGPVFVIDYPATLCPLTKRKRGDDRIAERFELYIAGMEIANAYTELNDPLLQEFLFSSQLSGLAEEDSMARMDTDFIQALKHGMPPAGGLGIGIDRLCMLLTDSQTIRDVIIFPLLRPERTGSSRGDKDPSTPDAPPSEADTSPP